MTMSKSVILVVVILCFALDVCNAQLYGLTIHEKEHKTTLVEISNDGSMKKLAHFKDNLAVPGLSAIDSTPKIFYTITETKAKTIQLIGIDLESHSIVSETSLPILTRNASIATSPGGFVYVTAYNANNTDEFNIYEVDTNKESCRSVFTLGKLGDDQFSKTSIFDENLNTLWIIRGKYFNEKSVMLALDRYDVKQENVTTETKPANIFKMWIDKGAKHGYLKGITFCPPPFPGHCLAHVNITDEPKVIVGSRLNDIGLFTAANVAWNESDSLVYVIAEYSGSSDPIYLFSVHLEDAKIDNKVEICKNQDDSSCPIGIGYL